MSPNRTGPSRRKTEHLLRVKTRTLRGSFASLHRRGRCRDFVSEAGESSVAAIEVRKARITDVRDIARLVNRYASVGDVLPRSEEELYDAVRDFFVADEGGVVLGCSSLKIMGGDLAEVRSLVVAEESQGLGLGRALVEACVQEAADLGISRVFALTARPHFFEKLGFRKVPRSTFPQKIWRDCFSCKFFEACSEVAVQRDLDGAVRPAESPANP